jgi:hypothetical protein
MKSLVLVVLFICAFFFFYCTALEAAESEATVKVITKIASERTTLEGETRTNVIKIDDPVNGVICYGLVSSSMSGRSAIGGYPNSSIDCVKIDKGK